MSCVFPLYQLIRIIKLLGTDRTKQQEQLTANTLFDTVAEMVQDGCPRGATVRRYVFRGV